MSLKVASGSVGQLFWGQRPVGGRRKVCTVHVCRGSVEDETVCMAFPYGPDSNRYLAIK